MPNKKASYEAQQRAEYLKEESYILSRDIALLGLINRREWRKWWSDASGAYRSPEVRNGR